MVRHTLGSRLGLVGPIIVQGQLFPKGQLGVDQLGTEIAVAEVRGEPLACRFIDPAIDPRGQFLEIRACG
ncbi:MAG: hypothetical protein AAGM22_15245 [Acidobacteriota bacterium]